MKKGHKTTTTKKLKLLPIEMPQVVIGTTIVNSLKGVSLLQRLLFVIGLWRVKLILKTSVVS